MNTLTSVLLVTGLVLVGLAADADQALHLPAHPEALEAHPSPPLGALLRPAASDSLANQVIETYCLRCHGERRQRGNLRLDAFDVGAAGQSAEVAEKMIRKLRAGMMPPPGSRRPDEATLTALVEALEVRVDESAAADPNPGRRTFQRLNQAEYGSSIRALLGLDIDPAAYFPSETMSGGFDNVADVQTLSPTLLDAYLTAAGEISRLALGDPNATARETTYKVPRYASQRDRVEGAPFGTRGGASVIHNFLADGQYVFRMSFQHESTGNLFGQTAVFDEQLEISVNGERMALMDVDRWMHVQDPNGVNMTSDPIFIRAGPQRVSVAFLRKSEGPLEDLMSPHGWSLADKKIGYSYGITSVPHLRDFAIGGPYGVTGVAETPIRRRILTCRPNAESEREPCAREIISRLGTQAFRRPLTPVDIEGLMVLYQAGESEGGFETGIRTALQGILASPDFVFRFEEPTGSVTPGESYRISDLDLATRLSFFLWAAPPDDELMQVARQGKLADPAVLEQHARRMLADRRSEALGTRFAAQWLRLQDLDKIHPDALAFPDFYQQLADGMRHETELFFNSFVREDKSVLELLTADHTYINERLAEHYGIPGVSGEHFRRVAYPDATRRGLLGHGSILTLTSHANRTSPVLRGKWVMEVFLGSPPPPPPPNVPDLEATEEVEDGRILTVRERMERHRSDPQCRSCHRVMDPIGLALENFDVTGRWRIRDNGMLVDPVGELYDGSELNGPEDLRQALLRRPEALVRTFTENLLAYALGRRVEYYDMPTIRAITREASDNEYRMSTFIVGVVNSRAFQMSRAVATVQEGPEGR